MSLPNVLGHAPALTAMDFRERLSGPLGDLCEMIGRGEIAREIGCDPETVSNARAERTTLNAAQVFNLLRVDPTALNPVLKHFGLVAVAIDGGQDEDDAVFAAIEDELTDVLSLAAKSRRAIGRLCHRTKAGMLKALDRASGKRARLGRRS